MPEKPSTDELAIGQPTGPAMPVWAPNPDVPILARILAYTFGGLMLLTFIANCMSHPAADIPKFPKAWETMQLQGCTVAYPQGWHEYKQVMEDGSAILTVSIIALLPDNAYPVRVEVILRKLPEEELDSSLTSLLNQEVQQNLEGRQYDEFQVKQDGGPYTDSRATFSYLQERAKMSGEWTIVNDGEYAVIFIGHSTTQGWPAMQVILHEMASRVKWE